MELKIPYSFLGKMEYRFEKQNIEILDKVFGEQVCLKLRMKEEDFPSFLKEIQEYGKDGLLLANRKCRWYTS